MQKDIMLKLGFRGNWKFLRWDVNGLSCCNTIIALEHLPKQMQTELFILYRTNIGNSLTKGVEIFIQGDWLLGNKTILSFLLLLHLYMRDTRMQL